jgi:putative endonuclease
MMRPQANCSLRVIPLIFWIVIPQRSGGICFLLVSARMSVMPPHEYNFHVYILSSRSRTLYIGVTKHLQVRVLQHREMVPGSFTARYNITRLVYCERFQYIQNAIARETELKDWSRARKIALIESVNPTWEDLEAEW